jgi:cobalamin synthase
VRWTGPFESAALLTAWPVPARLATSTRGVLRWAPLVGLVLGGLAAGVAVVGARWISPLVGAVLAVAVLALLTRGLHLDGLADTADGLGPLRDRDRALQVMHRGDVGPFGVATLVLTLLLQVACAAALLSAEGGWLALWSAVLVARLAMVRTGLPGVAVAAGSSLGRAVAGTVPRTWWVAVVVAGAGLVAGGALLVDGLSGAVALLAAAAAGLLAAEGVHRRATARLGGTTGDVMGAMGEVAMTAHLLTAAALWG